MMQKLKYLPVTAIRS